MTTNNSDLKNLGDSITKLFAAASNENRKKAIARIEDAIAFYNAVYEKFSLNSESDPMLENSAADYWSNFLPQYHISNAVAAYRQVTGISDVRFVHDGVFYEVCDHFFNDEEFAKKFDNKAYYPLLFHDVVQPKVIAMRMNNLWVDPEYRTVSLDSVVQMCGQEGCIVMKYAKGSCGGAGVKFFNSVNLTDLKAELLSSKLDIVLQAVQSQCKELREIHPDSLNTVRVMTLFLNSGAVALSSVLRMGINGSRVDNASAGGIVCGINAQGYTKEFAYDKYGKRYTDHPSGTAFANIHIRGFADCINKSIALQERFPYCRMISWDWAISENETPVLIEANLCEGELEFHQFCNGPIFADLTERVFQEILSDRSIYL